MTVLRKAALALMMFTVVVCALESMALGLVFALDRMRNGKR
jgi:hypothetical protein